MIERFPFELDTRKMNGFNWLLLARFRYRSAALGVIDVPAGFVTDLASVPFGVRGIVSRDGDQTKPAVIHDYLYSRASAAHWPGVTRRMADRVFLEALTVRGVPRWTRWAMFAGVRVFGVLSFRRPPPLDHAPI